MLCFFFRYYLQPRENGGKSVKVEELGSLRLNIVYTEDHVFPSEHYTPLRDLLLCSALVQVQYEHVNVSPLRRPHAAVWFTPRPLLVLSVQPVSSSTAHTLGEVCREKQEAAIPLVRLFLHYGKIVPFISAIAHAEVNRTQWVSCRMLSLWTTPETSSAANTGSSLTSEGSCYLCLQWNESSPFFISLLFIRDFIKLRVQLQMCHHRRFQTWILDNFWKFGSGYVQDFSFPHIKNSAGGTFSRGGGGAST